MRKGIRLEDLKEHKGPSFSCIPKRTMEATGNNDMIGPCNEEMAHWVMWLKQKDEYLSLNPQQSYENLGVFVHL